MHELLLLGQVPASRHAQVLSVLTGLTAAQPQRVVERHVLFKPVRSVPSDGPQRGGTQVIAAAKTNQTAAGKELFHLRLVKQLKETEFGSVSDEESSKRLSNEGWEMLFRDTPEPGRKEASFRMVQQIQIQSEDPMRYMELLGYRHHFQYVVEGHKFVFNNVVFFLHRLLQFPSPGPTGIDSTLPSFHMLKPLDPSGAFLFEATVLLSDGTNPEVVKLGLKEIDMAKSRLNGVVNLDIPDRLALDTRVK